MQVGQLYKLTKEAARHAFDKPKTRGKRQDCDARLRRIINDRKSATMRHDDVTVKRLTRELKKLARKIKTEKLISELSDNKWDPVKMHKKGYTPKHTKLKDLQGRQVHDRLRATTFADYYEQRHWTIEHEDREDISEEPIWPTNEEVETNEITAKELDEAIRKLKNNKAPGPDEIPAELFKWLDEQSRKKHIINVK